MHPRITELLAYLDQQRAELRAAFDAVPPDRRDQSPAPDRWSAAQIVEHVAMVERRVAAVIASRVALAREVRLESDTSRDPVLPAMNLSQLTDRSRPLKAPETAQPTGLGWMEAWAALERAGQLVRGAASDGDGLALGVLAAPHPVMGPMSIYEWIAFVGAHEGRHAAQIREMGSEEGNLTI